MRVLSIAARLVLKGSQKLVSWAKTAQAGLDASLGSGWRILQTGSVVNIGGGRDRITLGKKCAIGGQLLVFAHGGQIRLGDYVFVGEGSHIWSAAEIMIGNRVLISHGVEIHDTESHSLDAQARAAQTIHIMEKGHPAEIEGIRSKAIRIGDDVWIGYGAVVRKGVTIGDRAIIGARSIVDRTFRRMPWCG